MNATRVRVARAIVAVVLVIFGAAVYGELTPQQLKLAKDGTALVVISQQGQKKAFASAFCIDRAGLFVTNAHVLDEVVGGSRLRLVINPGEANQKVVDANALEISSATDLAVLETPDYKSEASLEMGESKELYDTQPVTAFGYPFGDALAGDDEYPSISVNQGRITSLRKRHGDLDVIQVDVALNPGNSGGPVLDAQGKVIGIVHSGVVGAGVNFLIPISRLKELIRTPQVQLRPTTLPIEKQHEEMELRVKVVTVQRPPPEYEIEVEVASQGSERRTFPARRSAECPDTYLAKVVPVPTKDQSAHLLRVEAKFNSGSITAVALDRTVKVAGREYELSNIHHYDRENGASLRDGGTVPGLIGGVEDTVLELGGNQKVHLDLSNAISISIADLNVPVREVWVHVTVKEKNQTLVEHKDVIALVKPGSVAMRVGIMHTDGGDFPVEIPSPGPPSPAPGSIHSGGSNNNAADDVDEKKLGEGVMVRMLPAPVDDVVAGGGGRYLILQMKKVRKLAIFDVRESKVSSYIPLASDDVLFGATLDKVLVILRDQRIVQRWNLASGQRELTTSLQEPGQVDCIAVGCASEGLPAMLMTRNGPKFIDLATLRPFAVTEDTRTGQWHPNGQYPLSVRASADGATFAAWQPNISPTGVRLLRLEGHKAICSYEHNSFGVLLPSADGAVLFTGNGVLNSELKQVNEEAFRGITCIPSYNPSYFVGLKQSDPYLNSGPKQQRKAGPALSIYSTGDYRMLVTLDRFPELAQRVVDQDRWGKSTLTLDKRIHFTPDENLLVTIADSCQKIVLRPFRVADAMEKAGIDYLFVASSPARKAIAGQTYKYALAVKSRRGGVKWSLESGPEGMKLSDDGKLEWPVPSDQASGPVSVIILIKDASAQETYHTFNINVLGKEPAAEPATPPRGKAPRGSV